MNSHIIGRSYKLALIIVIIFSSISCVHIDERLGQNFIPYENQWDVYTGSQKLEDVRMRVSDSLSAYSSLKFVVGSVCENNNNYQTAGTCLTLIPVNGGDLDLGENPEVKEFHFTAIRDTVFVLDQTDTKMLQKISVYPMKKALDSLSLYIGTFEDMYTDPETSLQTPMKDVYIDLSQKITIGSPVYNGGDSLSFNFNKTWAQNFVTTLQNLEDEEKTDFVKFVSKLPGIYITTDDQTTKGGRMNMFQITLKTDSYGYVDGNYAELKLSSTYEGEKKDTSFLFALGMASFIDAKSRKLPDQFAFNTSRQVSEHGPKTLEEKTNGVAATNVLAVNGGSGVKPVIPAQEILDKMLDIFEAQNIDESLYHKIMINRATLIFN